MGKIVTELGGALGVLLTSLGTRSGLWAALAGAGPLTTEEVAAKVLVDPALVREWLRAQAAGGYLDYDPVRGTFQLPDAVAAAIHEGPGGALVDAAATMMSSMGEGFGAFSEAFSTGQGFGWHQRTAEHWHGTDAFTRVALPTELIAAAIDQLRRRRVGADQRWLGGGRRLRLRHADAWGSPSCIRRPPCWASTTTTPRSRMLAPRPPRPASATPGSRSSRPPSWPADRLRPDHLLRLVARHRGCRRGASRGPGGARTHGCGAAVRADGRRRRPGQPQPGRPDVLRRLDARVHAQRGLAADDAPHRSRWAPRPASSGCARWPPRPASPGSAGPSVEAPMNLILELRP